jgi:hypothetical protein
MSGPTFSLHSTYRPTEGSGTIRITFPDLRKSTRKNADDLVNKQIARIAKDHPGTVITAQLREGSRFASSWNYELSTTKPAKPAPLTRK